VSAMTLLRWLFGAPAYVVPYLSNKDRRALYTQRSAYLQAEDPATWDERQRKGRALQSMLRRPRVTRTGNVLKLKRAQP